MPLLILIRKDYKELSTEKFYLVKNVKLLNKNWPLYRQDLDSDQKPAVENKNKRKVLNFDSKEYMSPNANYISYKYKVHTQSNIYKQNGQKTCFLS